MCGRYELKAKARELNKQFQPLHLAQHEMPRATNMHPTDWVLMITGNRDGYLGGYAKWGLVGRFLDKEPRSPLLSLGSEGLAAKPFYGKILKQNRCLIPATAFYEWQSRTAGKQELRIRHAKDKVLMFAGIYDHHPLAGTTCAILTTATDETMSLLHDRMPLILGRDESAFWLDAHEEFPVAEFEAMTQLPSPDALAIEAVIEEESSPQLSLIFA